jgi:hypothetical protein
MDACVLRKVDEACQRRLLEMGDAVVVDVHLALVKEKVCAKPKTSGPSAAAKGLQVRIHAVQVSLKTTGN